MGASVELRLSSLAFMGGQSVIIDACIVGLIASGHWLADHSRVPCVAVTHRLQLLLYS